MPTVAEVMNDVADECSVNPPNSWITATTLSYRDLKRFLRKTVDELLDRIDWPDPITKDVVITGTGVAAYNLPSDFKRLTRDQWCVYETTTTRRAGIPVTTNGDWTFLQDVGSAGGDRYYRTSGDEQNGYQIEFFRALETSAGVTVSYVSNNWLSVSGSEGSIWTDPAAVLLLPRELIEMGCVWRFRRRKGLPFADRLNEYEGKLARLANDARQIKRINFGETPERHPWDIPVPDFIPSA